MSLFVTGTDTGVGKTHQTSQLLRLLRAEGVRCAGFKPICCGDRGDAEQLHAASSEGFRLDEINPVWLRAPAAPLVAAREEGVEIDPHSLLAAFHQLARRVDFIAVEGVGGWQVPITSCYAMSDLAAALELPVIVIVANKLGCLNHTLLTCESIRARGLEVAAVVLNSIDAEASAATETNGPILRELLRLPIIAPLQKSMTRLPGEWRQLITQ